jgi:antitoxin MazE
MAELIRIGNSQGIRIPKALIEQAGLEGVELELKLTRDGLLIKPQHKARKDWQGKIQTALDAGQVSYDSDWLEADLDTKLPAER